MLRRILFAPTRAFRHKVAQYHVVSLQSMPSHKFDIAVKQAEPTAFAKYVKSVDSQHGDIKQRFTHEDLPSFLQTIATQYDFTTLKNALLFLDTSKQSFPVEFSTKFLAAIVNHGSLTVSSSEHTDAFRSANVIL